MKVLTFFLVTVFLPVAATKAQETTDQPIRLSERALASSLPTQVHSCKPGKWGRLQYHYIYLEAPSSTVDLLNVPSRRTVWHFPEKTAEQIEIFLIGSGAPEAEVRSCLNLSVPFHLGGTFKFFPSAQLILELSPSARQIIYAELRRWPENRYYHRPVIIPTADIPEWYRYSGLKLETIALIQQLSYPLGKALAFSDFPTVIQSFRGDIDERAFLKAMTRTRSLILSLKIEHGDDLEALKNYWSAGYKAKDVLPLFEAVAAVAGADSIDIGRLLPPTPRKYLYTFPSRSLGIEGSYPDSFWTSLNFFNFVPDERFNDYDSVIKFAESQYEISKEPLQFGDLIIMKDAESGKSFHSCTFIADDIVYSKAGRSILHPFVLTRLEELYNRFAIEDTPLLEVWKKKERGN